MKKVKSGDYSLQDIEKLLKPKFVVHLLNGLVLIAPYLHLFRVIAEKSYDELPRITIATGITLPLFTLNWVWYVIDLRNYKKNAKVFFDEIESAKQSLLDESEK